MDENVKEKILCLADLISKWEIWDVDHDCPLELKTAIKGGKED